MHLKIKFISKKQIFNTIKYKFVQIIKKITNSTFAKNVAMVATGSIIAQAISIVFMPLITRLYSPEELGLQSVFMSIAGIFTVIVGLGYPSAIVIASSDRIAIEIIKLSVLVGVIITFTTTVLLLVGGESFLKILNVESIASYVTLLPIAMIVALFGAIALNWLMRKKAFIQSSVSGIIASLIVNLVKIFGGMNGPSALYLIVASVLTLFLGPLIALCIWCKDCHFKKNIFKCKLNLHTIKKIAIKYKDFALMRTPQELINGFSMSMPVFFLSIFFGSGSVGSYTLAVTILGMPSNLVASSITSVFYPRITAAIHNNEDAKGLIINLTLVMLISGLIPLAIVVFWGPGLFAAIFGEEWRSAGEYAQILSFWLFLQYLNKPAVAAIPALRLQGGLLLYEIISTSAKIFAIWIGFELFDDDLIAIGIYSFAGFICYVILIGWIFISLGRSR